MKRREFIKSATGLAIAAGTAGLLKPVAALAANPETTVAGFPATDDSPFDPDGPLIVSAPMLQNWAETSIGIAFGVSSMANGYVLIGEREDLSDARKIMCGGFRVTDVNDKVMLIRVTGLKPATKYFYRIGADRVSYKGGYKMKVTGNEEDPRTYSFTTAGTQARAHFCVINDTHAQMVTFGAAVDKIAGIAPSCVIWNGDATNTQETIESQMRIFLVPGIERKDYASEIPYLLCPGNHDDRGWAGRHLERVWMFRQPEERPSRDWDLGRNFAIRMGDVAIIGLDTAEDKMDSNPRFAGLFNSGEYRRAQAVWLSEVLEREDIASAPFLVACCHIPIHDDDPAHNPGDIAPADSDPRYNTDFAMWQRTCAQLWGPLLNKAGCQLVITAHQHKYRCLPSGPDRSWTELIGGSPDMGFRGKGENRTQDDSRFPTVIEGQVKGKRLRITVHNLMTGKVVDTMVFRPRK